MWFPRVKGVNAKVGDFWATQIQWKLMEDAALDKVLNLQFLGQHQSQWILMKDAALDKDPQSIIFKVFIAVG